MARAALPCMNIWGIFCFVWVTPLLHWPPGSVHERWEVRLLNFYPVKSARVSCMNKGLLCLLCIALALQGCAGLRNRQSQLLNTVPPGGSSAAFTLLNQLSSRDFESLSWSATGQIGVVLDGRRMESAFQMRMQRDSILWISLKPMLGMEAFRARITRDSLQFVNRLNREFGSYPMAKLNDLAGTRVDPRMLHELLLGLVGGMRNVAFQFSPDEPGLMSGSAGKVTYALRADTINMRPHSLQLAGHEGRLEVDYQSWMPIGDRRAPERLTLRAIPKATESQKATELELTFSKIVPEQAQEFPFSIPSGYRRMP
ncbi:MAG: DUF4292 domain-containing protein [Bacteroidetes bacterium]|nr:DUF4292 domain-containing protein [Bacteroidota bacterium]